MKGRRFKAVSLALEKIAKNTGEDEDFLICDLEEQFDTKITKEEVSSLRDVLRAERIWIWVLKPFNQKDYEIQKINFFSIACQYPDFVEQYVKKEKLEGKYYLKYLEHTLLSCVQDFIFECLKEQHGIIYGHFTVSEWEEILFSKEFKRAELQTAREIIAHECYHKIMKENN